MPALPLEDRSPLDCTLANAATWLAETARLGRDRRRAGCATTRSGSHREDGVGPVREVPRGLR